jgi:hypothetical protein
MGGLIWTFPLIITQFSFEARCIIGGSRPIIFACALSANQTALHVAYEFITSFGAVTCILKSLEEISVNEATIFAGGIFKSADTPTELCIIRKLANNTSIFITIFS